MLAPRPRGLSEEEPPLEENDLGDCTGLVGLSEMYKTDVL